MFYQILPSPQVKRYAIIIYKHGIQVLPNESSCQNENFVNTAHAIFAAERAFMPLKEKKKLLILAKLSTLEKRKLNFSCTALFHVKTRVNFKYFVNNFR